MSNTDKIKWNITLQRLQKFMGAMNYVMCCNQETEREKCLASLLEKSLIDKNIYKYIKEVYSVQCDIKFSLDKVKSNKEFGKFGTSQPINISTNNKVNNTKPYKKITLLDIDTIFDRAEREYKIQRVIDLADVSKFANYRATLDQLERFVPGAILKYIQEYGYEDICDFFVELIEDDTYGYKIVFTRASNHIEEHRVKVIDFFALVSIKPSDKVVRMIMDDIKEGYYEVKIMNKRYSNAAECQRIEQQKTDELKQYGNEKLYYMFKVVFGLKDILGSVYEYMRVSNRRCPQGIADNTDITGRVHRTSGGLGVRRDYDHDIDRFKF